MAVVIVVHIRRLTLLNIIHQLYINVLLIVHSTECEPSKVGAHSLVQQLRKSS